MTDQSNDSVKGHANSTNTGPKAVRIDIMPKHIDENILFAALIWMSIDIYFYRIISSKASLFVSFVQTAYLVMVKQQTVKCQPDRYESFLSLGTLDQVLRLLEYVSFVRTGPRGRLLLNLVPIDSRQKNCETHPKQCARNIIIDIRLSVIFFCFLKEVSLFTAAMDVFFFFFFLRLNIPCYYLTIMVISPNDRVYIRLVLKTYSFSLKCQIF